MVLNELRRTAEEPTDDSLRRQKRNAIFQHSTSMSYLYRVILLGILKKYVSREMNKVRGQIQNQPKIQHTGYELNIGGT